MPGHSFKVSFFVWIAFHDKILTMGHLKSIDWNMVNWCVLCLVEEGSVDYFVCSLQGVEESKEFFYLPF